MKKLDTILIIVATSLMTLIVTGISYERLVVQPLKREAVVNGHATWEVINRSTGQTKFKWVEPETNILDELEKPLGMIDGEAINGK